MNLSRTAAGLLAAAATAMLLAVAACSTTGGSAVRSAPATPISTGMTTSTTSSDGTGTAVPTTTMGSGGPSPTRPVPPPTCSELPDKLVTPTGTPMITVTQGANSWISNWGTEPLALAVYADGSGLASDGIGKSNEPLTTLRLGYVPSCVRNWATSELSQLSGLDMGEPGITDQGTTVITYTPAGGKPVKISVYALGSGDRYVLSGRENRARLTTVLGTLRKAFDGAAVWTPDRLKIVEVTAPVPSAGAALVWPASPPLDEVLVGRMGNQRCGVVSGADADAVRKTLAARAVHARWTDAGKVTGLNIGPLVPGQDPCAAS